MGTTRRRFLKSALAAGAFGGRAALRLDRRHRERARTNMRIASRTISALSMPGFATSTALRNSSSSIVIVVLMACDLSSIMMHFSITWGAQQTPRGDANKHKNLPSPRAAYRFRSSSRRLVVTIRVAPCRFSANTSRLSPVAR